MENLEKLVQKICMEILMHAIKKLTIKMEIFH